MDHTYLPKSCLYNKNDSIYHYNDQIINAVLDQPDNLTFTVSTGPKLTKKWNLLSHQHLLEINLENVGKLWTLGKLFEAILTKFGERKTDGLTFGLRLNGYDEYLVSSEEKILINFTHIFAHFRERRKINVIYELIEPEKELYNVYADKQTVILPEKLDPILLPDWKRLQNSAKLLTTLLDDLENIEISDLSPLKNIANAISSICCKIEPISVITIFEEMEKLNKSYDNDREQLIQFLKFVKAELKDLVKRFQRSIDCYTVSSVGCMQIDDLLTRNGDYSHQNQQPDIPLYIKIDSLHGIPLDLKNRKAKIKIILKKGSSNKPLFIKIKEFQETQIFQLINIQVSSIFQTVDISQHLDFDFLLNELPLDAYLEFQLFVSSKILVTSPRNSRIKTGPEPETEMDDNLSIASQNSLPHSVIENTNSNQSTPSKTSQITEPNDEIIQSIETELFKMIASFQLNLFNDKFNFNSGSHLIPLVFYDNDCGNGAKNYFYDQLILKVSLPKITINFLENWFLFSDTEKHCPVVLYEKDDCNNFNGQILNPTEKFMTKNLISSTQEQIINKISIDLVPKYIESHDLFSNYFVFSVLNLLKTIKSDTTSSLKSSKKYYSCPNLTLSLLAINDQIIRTFVIQEFLPNWQPIYYHKYLSVLFENFLYFSNYFNDFAMGKFLLELVTERFQTLLPRLFYLLLSTDFSNRSSGDDNNILHQDKLHYFQNLLIQKISKINSKLYDQIVENLSHLDKISNISESDKINSENFSKNKAIQQSILEHLLDETGLSINENIRISDMGENFNKEKPMNLFGGFRSQESKRSQKSNDGSQVGEDYMVVQLDSQDSQSSLNDPDQSTSKLRNPFYFHLKKSNLSPHNCKIFTSNARPISLCFYHEQSNLYTKVLLKSCQHFEEDIVQDNFVCDLIKAIDDIWIANGLDLKVVSYSCMALPTRSLSTTMKETQRHDPFLLSDRNSKMSISNSEISTPNQKGLIEMVGDPIGNTKSLREICGISGTFKDDSIYNYFEASAYPEHLDQFLKSLAAYSIISYIVGLGDRHNDNILLTRDGRIFHVDFGNCFGNVKKWGSFNRDRSPFLLTREMYFCLEKYGNKNDKTKTELDGFHYFIEVCQQAYAILRKNCGPVINLLKLSNNYSGNLTFVTNRLNLDKSTPEAFQIFEKLIFEAINDNFARINFLIHSINQSWTINSFSMLLKMKNEKNEYEGHEMALKNQRTFSREDSSFESSNGEKIERFIRRNQAGIKLTSEVLQDQKTVHFYIHEVCLFGEDPEVFGNVVRKDQNQDKPEKVKEKDANPSELILPQDHPLSIKNLAFEITQISLSEPPKYKDKILTGSVSHKAQFTQTQMDRAKNSKDKHLYSVKSHEVLAIKCEKISVEKLRHFVKITEERKRLAENSPSLAAKIKRNFSYLSYFQKEDDKEKEQQPVNQDEEIAKLMAKHSSLKLTIRNNSTFFNRKVLAEILLDFDDVIITGSGSEEQSYGNYSRLNNQWIDFVQLS